MFRQRCQESLIAKDEVIFETQNPAIPDSSTRHWPGSPRTGSFDSKNPAKNTSWSRRRGMAKGEKCPKVRSRINPGRLAGRGPFQCRWTPQTRSLYINFTVAPTRRCSFDALIFFENRRSRNVNREGRYLVFASPRKAGADAGWTCCCQDFRICGLSRVQSSGSFIGCMLECGSTI